jgi:hypothetical protein
MLRYPGYLLLGNGEQSYFKGDFPHAIICGKKIGVLKDVFCILVHLIHLIIDVYLQLRFFLH